MKERDWLWFTGIDGIGARTARQMLPFFDYDPEGIFRASEAELLAAGADHLQAAAILADRDPGRYDRLLQRQQENGIHMSFYTGKDFPRGIKLLEDGPVVLYWKGHLPDNSRKSVAIVGTRNCTAYGSEMARQWAHTLSEAGVQIISGLAVGIDSFAHRGALDAGGVTFGLEGCGLDICYPSQNFRLFLEMQQKGGVLSEYPAGTEVKAQHFPMRNRLISGIADAVLVVEAREKSGSLITADMGNDQGKEIFAMPGRVTDELSAGCHRLIREGATLASRPADILEGLDLSTQLELPLSMDHAPISEAERRILSLLDTTPKSLSRIHTESKLPLDEVVNLVISMELKGYIRQVTKNYFIKTLFFQLQ